MILNGSAPGCRDIKDDWQRKEQKTKVEFFKTWHDFKLIVAFPPYITSLERKDAIERPCFRPSTPKEKTGYKV